MPSDGLGWGCHSPKPTRPHGASSNSFIRFHFTGSLEVSLMVLDLWDHTQILTDLEKYKHIPFGVVRARLLCLPAQPNTLLPPSRLQPTAAAGHARDSI